MPTALSPDEQLAFAGLARMLIRADGEFTAEEQYVVEKVTAELVSGFTPDGSPDRDRVVPPEPDPEATWALIDRAGRELRDEAAALRAAERVTSPEAREAIYRALREIAEADVISEAEWPLLDSLARLWGIET
jgi:uncharacterized tellurite resistance protein B-like protein